MVSIVIPVYNGADYLSEAIESALAQTYRDIEILVVNDGSSDNGETERIAKSYGERIRYFDKPNGGVASALNLGIERMVGKYFSWLSHDDLYFPNKIEAQIEYIRGREGKLVVFSDYEIFSDAGTLAQIRLDAGKPSDFRFFITMNNSLHGCTLLIPRAAFDVSGRFNETLRTTQDYDMWFRMAKYFDFLHLPKILVRSRSHPGQGTFKLRSAALAEINTLLNGFLKQLSGPEIRTFTGKPLSIAYADIARNMARRGFLATSRYASMLSLRFADNRSLRQMGQSIISLMYALFLGPAALALRLLKQLITMRLRSR